MNELIDEYRYLSTRYGTIKDIYEQFSLTPTQFQWYINKVKRHKELVVQEYPTTSLEAFLATGRNVFHMTDLSKHSTRMPIDRKWGDLLIWEQPLKDFRYVIGVDPAEGRGGDNSVIEVFNAYTGEQAAEFASNYIAPDRLGLLAIDIGKMYNKALINVEANNHGHAVLQVMKTKYFNMYRREVVDRVTNEKHSILGWNSNGTTKPLLVDNLEESVREKSICIYSEECLKEMKIFVQTDISGKHGFGAEGSGKDDRVIACGLAVQAIRDTPRQKKPENLAQTKLREYAERHGLPKDFSAIDKMLDEDVIFPPDRPSPIITSRNRPNAMMRK